MHNPLAQASLPIAFPAVGAEHVRGAVTDTLEEARAALDTLAHAEPSYEAVLGLLDRSSRRLDYVAAVIAHLESVLDWPEFRTEYNAVQSELAQFSTRLATDASLFAALSRLKESTDTQDLDPVRQRHVHKSWDELRRSGAALGADDKLSLERIDVELSELTTRYAQNAVDATAAFELLVDDEARLAGLPPSALQAAKRSAEERGQAGYRFTLDAPSYVPAATYLDDAGLRETLYRAFATRAAEANAPLVVRILSLRKQKATLLGYRDFADLVLADRMAGNGATAADFVARLRAAAEPRFLDEARELEAFKREQTGTDEALHPWDVAYYAEKLRRARYAIDDEALRPYFPLDHVLSGMFELAARLFEVEVVQLQGVPTWHPDVRVYRASRRGKALGVFYFDLHPRPGKRDGAWMHGLIDRGGLGGVSGAAEDHEAVGLVVGNMTKPDAEGRCLLLHREVQTLFHEFGHLLHHLLSEVPVRALSGTKVAWDFVELPSQILENWTWEKQALAFVSKHHETGAHLPDDVIERLQQARRFRAATAIMRQVGFSTADLALHRDYDEARDGDVLAYTRKVMQPFAPTPLPDDYAMIASFTHLFASPVGYAAAYYSYQWAEALDADAFGAFRENGLFDRKTGAAFVDCVLARGDSEDPRALFRRFRGRDVDPNAMLQRLGLQR